MKKDQKHEESFERYCPIVIQFIISSEEIIMTRKEIEDEMLKHKICKSRQVSKILEYMLGKNYLKQQKLLGSKRYGYVVNEEIISKENESFVTIGLTKTGKPIYDRITQTELRLEIKDMIKRYKKTIAKKKSDLHKDDELFYILHYTLLTVSLSWISRLLLAIHGGVFQNKIGKVTLAKKNIELFEEFMETLCWNFKERFPDGKYEFAIAGLLHFFERLDPYVGTDFSRTKVPVSSLIH